MQLRTLALVAILTAFGAAYGQNIGLTDQNFTTVNVTADYLLAEDQHYTPYSYVDGNSTLSHSYDSGLQSYNTASGRATYSDSVAFGTLQVNSTNLFTSGTNPDTNDSSQHQDLYGGSSDDLQGPEQNAAFLDTFTAQSAMTLNFLVTTQLDVTIVHSPQDATSYAGTISLEGNVNGSNAKGSTTDIFSTGTKFNQLSFTLNAGDTVNIELGQDVRAYGGTYYAQSVQTTSLTSSLTSTLAVWSPTAGAAWTTGSGHVYAVPEPAELAPLALAALGLFVRRRKA